MLDSDWEAELCRVANLRTLGRWAFAELTEVYQIEMIARGGGALAAFSA